MLKSGANLILLDEPTNDLDVETLSSLEAALEDFPGCAVIISHDRFFLDRIATHILSFEGDSHVEWFEGNFESTRRTRSAASARTPCYRSASSTRNSRGRDDRLVLPAAFSIASRVSLPTMPSAVSFLSP